MSSKATTNLCGIQQATISLSPKHCCEFCDPPWPQKIFTLILRADASILPSIDHEASNMSPHRLPVQDVMQAEDLFNSFALSTNAFLPDEPPLQRLVDPSYEHWEQLIANLPTLIRERTLRHHVNRSNVLSTGHLKTEREWRRAYVILTFLAHGYIWGDDMPSEVLVSKRFCLGMTD